MANLSSFHIKGKDHKVKFVEHLVVKEGVSCDIYSFNDDPSSDLAIVVVEEGYKTPLQKVLSGSSTIEGYMSGKAVLTITDPNGKSQSFSYPNDQISQETSVKIGQIMQWEAKTELVFSEVCTPPYQDGRYENLPE